MGINPEKFRLTQTREIGKRIPRRKQQRYLKGPIPLDWLLKAAAQPGKTLHVAIALWYLSGVKKSFTFRLSQKLLGEFGVSRKTSYMAINSLERAGLITTHRSKGRAAEICIIQPHPIQLEKIGYTA